MVERRFLAAVRRVAAGLLAVLCLVMVPAPRLLGNEMMPCDLPDFSAPHAEALAERLYASTQRQAHYLLGLVHPWERDSRRKLLTDSRSREHWIRPNTGAVQAFCFLNRFGPYDERIVGMPRERLRREAILPMIRYLVDTHSTGERVTGDGKPWGDAWQSAHWAQMLGRGAWWMGDDLPGELQQGVRRVVRHEAERIATSDPPYQLHGDTKAEENAWNAQILSVAVLLMPEDPRRGVWEEQFQRWALSAFLRPADAQSEAVVDGRPISEQFEGANMFDDFTVENHGFVHPDYMGCFTLSLGCATDFRMSQRGVPDALMYNVPGIYENLKWFLLPDGGFIYPSGQDWTLFRQPIWLTRHVLMYVYGRDEEAAALLERTVQIIERMQSRSDAGAVYLNDQYFFPSTQTDIASALARSWLHLHFADASVEPRYEPRQGILRLEQGKIILHRTATAVHSLSWGSQIMGQFVPLREDRLISPDQRSLIGEVCLGQAGEPLPVRLHSAEIDNTGDGFRATLVVDHGDAVRATLRLTSEQDGTLVVEENLKALRSVRTEMIATGLLGVLNNRDWIFESGTRQITCDGQTRSVAAHSGASFQSEGVRRISLDDVLLIEADEPLVVHYRGATGPERGRATDRLYLNCIPGAREWQSGQTIRRWRVAIQTK